MTDVPAAGEFADPSDRPVVDANMLSDPRDLEAARALVSGKRTPGAGPQP